MSVWLCQIAKNLWYDEYKKQKKIKNVEQNEAIDISSEENLEEQMISNEEKMDLYKKMQNLDNITREVMYLRITGELSFKEIGDILNKTENWARVTFYRAKQILGKELNKNE